MRTQFPLALLAGLGRFSSLTHALINTSHGQYPDICPGKCSRLGSDPAGWSQIHDLHRLEQCQEPLLFDVNVHHTVTDPKTLLTIRACSTAGADGDDDPQTQTETQTLAARAPGDYNSLRVDSSCGATPSTRKMKARKGTGMASARIGAQVDPEDVSAASQILADYLSTGASCGTTIMFAKSGNAVLGVYSGAQVIKSSAASMMHTFQTQSSDGSLGMEACTGNTTAAYTFGVLGAGMADLPVVQDAVKTWNDGRCLHWPEMQDTTDIQVGVLASAVDAGQEPSLKRSIHKRADCDDIQVKEGDTCASLATRCGISGDKFTKYNDDPKLCSSLMPKQYVCCTEGSLPDHTPQPNSDGSCRAFTIKPGHDCWKIADNYGITPADIEKYNKKTWGWAGCDRLQPGQVICLSKGDPPFPAPIEGNVCGPQVPGTKKPTDDTAWAELNPCPLNSCCDVWGFCGVTEEFCTESPADTGAPGTAQPHTNGCISNCGTDIVNNDEPPAEFRRIGYFEAWNRDRPCLTLDIKDLDYEGLTHIHFAFGTVTKDWKISVEEVEDQWKKFKELDLGDTKKVLSFGGWAFSTEEDTFQILRDATKPENRETFATNAAEFLEESGLHGLDFDWEYPGAPDIPGVPPGSEDEGDNYLEFLKLVKKKVGDKKSISIALPASYWYLRPYPVKQMTDVVDYFVYMTYDFHGQWDVGNEYAIPGCPGGNCLRSHVNITETKSALGMITKAGVDASKLIVGISSYGRSFRMKDSSCSDRMCTYTGDSTESKAYKGRCTETRGYISNAEIQEIIDGHKSDRKRDYELVKTGFDSKSDSNILIYGKEDAADWVAYMDEKTKKSRAEWIKGLNMGGTTDWAVDLREFVEEGSGGDDGDGGDDGGDDDSDDKCDPDDSTWEEHDMGGGEFQPWASMDPDVGETSQYVTIVNLTPYNFKVEHTHSYQMDTFEFGDVPAGHAIQNECQYRGGDTPVDDNGEAYYVIEGTDKKFTIRCTTHIPDDYPRRTVFDLTGMGAGQREYKDPGYDVPVTLVITGSEHWKDGFITNIKFGPGNWMNNMKDVIKSRPLKHVIMPGSHDAGMSRISNKIVSFGSAANTQTQGIHIGNQLKAGVRYFDLRILTVHEEALQPLRDYSFWVAHVNDNLADTAVGNTGESLTDIVGEINEFVDANPGEVIIFKLRYLNGIRKLPSGGPIYWNQEIVDKFFHELRSVHNRCLDLDDEIEFQKQPMEYFMKQNADKGCVLFIGTGDIPDDVQQYSPGDGIYNNTYMDITDHWSDMDNTENMANDQIKMWEGDDRDGDDDVFRIAQWLISADPLTSTSYGLENLAVQQANPVLYWYGENKLTPRVWPNVIMQDYIGVVVKNEHDWDQLSADLYTFCVGLNLYMVSENCKVNSHRPPLLSDPSSDSRMAKTGTKPAWNGVHFANGTIWDEVPADFHLGRVETLKTGTVFGDGSVVRTSQSNPNFRSSAG